MRLTILCVGIASLLVLLPSTVLSQAMLEHAITAAGGSAAGVAGKGVSDGIDKIFRKLDQQGQKATEAELPKRMKPQPEIGEAAVAPLGAGVITAARIPMAGSTPPPRTAASEQGPLPEPATWWPVPARETVPSPSVEDLEAIESGTSRQDVVARLGAPAARVIIPDQGLREVYLFHSRGTHLGKVTLTNGEVQSVHVAATAQ